MLTSIIASTLALGLSLQQPKLTCPMTGEDIGTAAAVIHYNGARFETCCGGCNAPFLKNPARALKSEAVKGKVIGKSLFDPVSGVKIDEKKQAAGSSVYNGIAFYFTSAENKTKFDAAPAKYGKLPEKEALYCPVMGHAVKNYAASGAYVDHAGVRYYLCCTGCLSAMKAEPAKFAPKASKAIKAPAATMVSSDGTTTHKHEGN